MKIGIFSTQGLDDTIITTEANIPLSWQDQEKKKRFCSSLHHNGSNSFLFVNAANISINSKQNTLK